MSPANSARSADAALLAPTRAKGKLVGPVEARASSADADPSRSGPRVNHRFYTRNDNHEVSAVSATSPCASLPPLPGAIPVGRPSRAQLPGPLFSDRTILTTMV